LQEKKEMILTTIENEG